MSTAEKMPIYVKSLEEDLATKRIVDGRKVIIQTIEQIVAEGNIQPNTVSFGQSPRLACTLLHENYTNTYREQGIIFTTEAVPDFISPVDLMLFAESDEIEAEYYRIRENLHFYYSHKLIKGFEKFIYQTPAQMFVEMQSPDDAWEKVNNFRISHGFARLDDSKKKLAAYNEVVFSRPIVIVPLACFGQGEIIRTRAQDLGMRLYASALEYYQQI